MRKLLCTVAALAAFNFPAQAEESLPFKPYVGVDLMRVNADYNNNYDAGGGVTLDGNALLEDSLNGFGIHVGNRFHKNFGAELGYFRTREEGKDIAAGETVGPGVVAAVPFSTDVKIHGFTLDGLGYLPLDEDSTVELVGTAGLSWNKAEAQFTVPGVGATSEDESEIGFRIGAGAQINLTEQISARALARYQSADFDDVADNLWIYSAGLNFSF
ncbi:MAG: porin family protein [Rhodospirillales bacterium]|nr:porin family protein [Rhodospirillales bacterium]MCB9995413.1 porin family protein [Rhodospirillales bacterium]